MAETATREIQTGNFQKASELLETALRQDAKSAELWNLLGIAQTELHRPKQAEGAFRHGLELAPDSTSLNENLGLLFFKGADYADAKKYLERAVALGSGNPAVLFSLAGAKLRTGEEARALSDLKQLETPLANYAEYWEERGTAEMSADPSAAGASFARALELSANSLRALNGAASVAEKQGLNEKALAFLIKARKAHPDDVPTLIHFGMVCLRRDLGLDAVDALERAHRLEPSNNTALYALARAHIALQNWQKSFDLFSEFSKRVPNFAPTYYALGWLDIKLNRTDDARQQLQHCLSLAPNLLDARYELAQVDLDRGDLDLAQKQFEIILKQNPLHAKANMAMGDIMMRNDKLDEAQHYLETAVRQDPKLSAAHYKLAMLYFRTHQTKQAEQERSIAASLNAQANQASKTQLRLAMPDSDIVQ